MIVRASSSERKSEINRTVLQAEPADLPTAPLEVLGRRLVRALARSKPRAPGRGGAAERARSP